jgi:hypothetical protein
LVVPVGTTKIPEPTRWDGSANVTGGKRKLTDEQVIELRRKRAAGMSIYEAARQYGVSRNTIYAAIKGKHGAPLPCPDQPCPASGQ